MAAKLKLPRFSATRIRPGEAPELNTSRTFDTLAQVLGSYATAIEANSSALNKTMTATGSAISGGGTANYVPLWLDATTQGNSIISQSGTTITVTGNETLTGILNLSSLTASTALALDASKNVISVTNTGSGNNVLATSPTISGTLTGAISNWSDILSITKTIGGSSSDGLVLQNTTTAMAGSQQLSPRIRWTGQGWKTDAIAASQTMDWTMDLRPLQGTANPTAELTLSRQINGGGYNDFVKISSLGIFEIGNAATLNANCPATDATHPHMFEVTNDNTSLQCIAMNTYGTPAANFFENNFHFNRYRGTLAAPTAIKSGDYIMSIGCRGYDGSALSQSMGGYQALATEDWDGTHGGMRYQWECTAPGSVTRVHLLELDARGHDMLATIGYNAYGVGTRDLSNKEWLQIDHSGANANTRIMVNAAGTGSYRDLDFYNGGSIGMVFSSARNFGIGPFTTSVSPSFLGHFVSNSAAEIALEECSTDTVGTIVSLRKARGTFAAPTNVVNGDMIWTLQGETYSQTYRQTAYIASIVDASVVNNQRTASRLEFYTNANNAAPVLALKIDGSQIITFSALTANTSLGLNASKQVISVAVTGSGNAVLATSPTIASPTFTGGITASGFTANRDVITDGSGNLALNVQTGTGNSVLSASPTLTGTITAAAANFSGVVMVNGATTATNYGLNVASAHIACSGAFAFLSYGVGTPGATNWEATGIDHSGTQGRIYVNKGGTGTYRSLIIQTNATTALTIDTSQVATFAGDVKLQAGFYLTKQASNPVIGQGTLVGGTLTINNTRATSTAHILIVDEGGGVLANIGALYEDKPNRVNGTSFIVKSSNALDTSSFTYIIVEQL